MESREGSLQQVELAVKRILVIALALVTALTVPAKSAKQSIALKSATKASPILFYVNNAGWQANTYPENTINDGQDYDGANNKVGVALKEGYVVVSYGGRSRSNDLTDGKYLYYVAKYTALKVAPSFSNVGLYDTGLTWDQYMATDEGKALAKEIKMTCAMEYLLENTADVAPYWYVRHGMDDRDNSFAVETTLFYSVKTSPKVKSGNVGFAWLKPHSGDYDVPEAYIWLKEVLAK